MSKVILSYLFKTNLATFRSAIIEDNTDKICRILDIERDYLNKDIDSGGNTALLLAIKYASPLTIRLLLEQGAQPDQINEVTLQTPLGLIASTVYEDYNSYKAQRLLEMAKILLDHGAYIDKPSIRHYKAENKQEYSAKETPLMTAVRKRNVPLVNFLIERKANIDYTERQLQIQAIHFAIRNGDETMFDILNNAGDVQSSSITDGGFTLLHWFCYKTENDECISLLEKLIEKGCDINASNFDERTPLMAAAKNNMINTCRLLLKKGADIDKRDRQENRAIDLCTPDSECSKLFLNASNTQKLKIPHTPTIKLSKTIVWKKRHELTRRFTSDSPKIIHYETDSQCVSAKESEDELQSNASPSLYIYPTERKDSTDSISTRERILGKLAQSRQRRQAARNLQKQRAYSTDTEVRSPS